MSNILHVCGWFDPSADVTRSVIELNKHSEHRHEALVKWHHPCKGLLRFPEPEGQSRDNGYVNEKFAWADAIIYHLVGWNHPLGYNVRTYGKPCAFRNANVMYDRTLGKFYCLQEFFSNPQDSMYELVASCHTGARDFMGEGTAFLPALMPIDDPLYTPDWTDREPCIAYIKHADEITERLAYMLDRPIERHRMNLQNLSFLTVMRLRREKATVTIDNVGEGHYGLAGTESLAQGIPAIAWNHPRTQAQLEDLAPCVGSPFIEVENVRTAVKVAKVWANERKGHGQIARQWIENYYNSKRLIERYWEPFVNKLLRK